MKLNYHYNYLSKPLLLSFSMLLPLTLTISLPHSFSSLQVTEDLFIKESYGELSSIYYLNVNTDNNINKSISVDKQLLVSEKNKMVVYIVENASNPTNKIFYDPSPITIKKGSSIVWINKDPTIHTVTSGKTDNDVTEYKFDSGMMSFNSTYVQKIR